MIEIRDLHAIDEFQAVDRARAGDLGLHRSRRRRHRAGVHHHGQARRHPHRRVRRRADGRVRVSRWSASRTARPMQWSHMVGVLPEYRRRAWAELKLAQRERALAAGFDLMEWTFDPLQALNAHLNFAKLGVVCEEYAVNLYGESTSALHRGTPTDRLVVQWRLGEPHVERRIEQPPEARHPGERGGGGPGREPDRGGGRRGAACGTIDLWHRRSPRLGGDPDRLHRDAAGGAGSRAGVAAAHARDLPALLRSRLPRRRFRAGAKRGIGRYLLARS